ncbi:MAG: UDP-N-acetylmuramoyl-L-alanine--D-glutamate ligase [Candidatus Gracilibacteria bacterium]|nr:UDP-N-acetylmuramoyl-L-alanine--D-glutamate ligase [Candidatus Gracilibacteria bacterium]
MNFHDTNIAIVGFAREGQSTLRFLLSHHVDPTKITILDKNTAAVIPDGFTSVLGENYLENLSPYDMLIVTPGISPYTRELQDYNGIITSQTDIFFRQYTGKIIGVTATKGKSTTVTLIHEMLRQAGKNVQLVGNIGTPVLDTVDLNNPLDWIVYELSSHMLEYSDLCLDIAVLGNIYPDHLIYHNGFENYKNAKLHILGNTKHAVVGKQVFDDGYLKMETDSITTEHGVRIQANIVQIPDTTGYHLNGDDLYNGTERIMSGAEIHLLGAHNKRNILSVFAVGKIAGIPEPVIRKVCSDFRGLPHRLEFVGAFDGINFYDDAISTTPESTIEGILALDGRVDTIFLGGQDRGYDFSHLAQVLKEQKIRNVVLFPDSGDRILPLLDQSSHRILSTISMKEAVQFAYTHTENGKTCLLSTASPSYNLWRNYEAKGDEFQKFVNENTY